MVLEEFQHCIQGQGAQGVNTSKSTTAETPAERAAREVKEKLEDKKAKAKLALTMDSSFIYTLKGLKRPLKQMFDDSGFSRRISLLMTLFSTRLEDCDSMNQYIN